MTNDNFTDAAHERAPLRSRRSRPMADQSYTPLEHEVRESFVIGQIRDGEGADWTEFEGQARAEFDRFIEAVKRDAAREALDGLADDQEQFAREIPAFGGQAHRLAGAARSYRDRHYPEEARA